MSDSINQDVVYALATEGDVCFAGRHSGLWRSDDGGSHWQPVDNIPGVPPSSPVSALALSPDFQSDGNVFAAKPGGVLRSSDAAKSWAITGLASPPPFVSALAVSPAYAQDGMVFAATLEDGVFWSNDRGVRWQAWNFGLFDRNILSIAVSPEFAQDRTVYVGTESGIFYSKNGGRAWYETGFPTDSAPVLSLAISSQMQTTLLFAGTESAGLFYSANSGYTWQQALNAASINAVLLSPGRDVLAVSSDALWVSHDAGQSWLREQPDVSLRTDLTAVAALGGFTSNTKVLLGMADGQIIQTLISTRL